MKKNFVKAFLLLVTLAHALSCATHSSPEREAGKEYYRQSDYEKAVKEFTKAIENEPGYWINYNYRSFAYQRIGEIDHAIKDLDEVLKLIPRIERWYSKLPNDEWSIIYMRRGILNHKRNHYDLAIDDFNQALELDPQCIAAYFYRAETKEKMNSLSAAIEDYTKVVDMMPELFSGVSDSDGARVYFKRGAAYARMEKFEKAISDFDNAIRENPEAAVDAYLYRASVKLITSCDLEEVLADYYSVIDIESIDDETRQLVYNQIAWILATAADDNIRDGKAALKYAQKSVDIKASCRNFDTLAIALAENDRFKDAIYTHKESIEICKSNNPELLTKVEKHLENYKLKNKLRETCPGAEIEMDQFRSWQKDYK